MIVEFQSQDYTPLASGSGDQTVRIWDVMSETSSIVMKVPDLDDKLPHSQKVKFWVPVGWVSQGQRLMSATSRYASSLTFHDIVMFSRFSITVLIMLSFVTF